MELARKILLAVWASDRPLDSALLRVSGYSPDQVADHFRLLQEAGLLDGLPTSSADRRPRWTELRLTWTGHDFIEAARNEQVWTRAKDVLASADGTVPVDLWRQALMEAALALLGRTPTGARLDGDPPA
jgi:hypothetical protein